jgi:hypothetical protein
MVKARGNVGVAYGLLYAAREIYEGLEKLNL